MDDEDKFTFYKWKCPECEVGTCEIVQLSEEFEAEVAQLDKAVMLEEVELSILNVLNESSRWMRAGEISGLIDETYQLVGRRTRKLQDLGLVEKNVVDGNRQSRILQKAKDIYFATVSQVRLGQSRR